MAARKDNTTQQTENETTAGRTLTRREALGTLGATGIVLLTGCGGGGSASATGATTTGTTAGTTPSAAAVTPEGEIGPYFTDDSPANFKRSSILSNLDGTNTQAGVPLTLKIVVLDSENSNAPVAGSQIDIWHCNAQGVYSNETSENTLGQTWLRGYQITDANGSVTFTTIIPGWYQGRTTHIHLRVRSKYSEAFSTSDGANTTQVFFPQSLLNTLSTSIAPYSSEGINPTTNASDHVFTPETLGETVLTLSGDTTSGYAATFTVYLPITSE